MIALNITEPGRMQVRDLDIPAPSPGEILLRPRVVGLCGTDSSMFRGKKSAGQSEGRARLL
jgi:threonine dehydrogenase-like Zn-dependent dehydrogenase